MEKNDLDRPVSEFQSVVDVELKGVYVYIYTYILIFLKATIIYWLKEVHSDKEWNSQGFS